MRIRQKWKKNKQQKKRLKSELEKGRELGNWADEWMRKRINVMTEGGLYLGIDT